VIAVRQDLDFTRCSFMPLRKCETLNSLSHSGHFFLAPVIARFLACCFAEVPCPIRSPIPLPAIAFSPNRRPFPLLLRDAIHASFLSEPSSAQAGAAFRQASFFSEPSGLHWGAAFRQASFSSEPSGQHWGKQIWELKNGRKQRGSTAIGLPSSRD
jgi:hypothetical protein